MQLSIIFSFFLRFTLYVGVTISLFNKEGIFHVVTTLPTVFVMENLYQLSIFEEELPENYQGQQQSYTHT